MCPIADLNIQRLTINFEPVTGGFVYCSTCKTELINVQKTPHKFSNVYSSKVFDVAGDINTDQRLLRRTLHLPVRCSAK